MIAATGPCSPPDVSRDSVFEMADWLLQFQIRPAASHPRLDRRLRGAGPRREDRIKGPIIHPNDPWCVPSAHGPLISAESQCWRSSRSTRASHASTTDRGTSGVACAAVDVLAFGTMSVTTSSFPVSLRSGAGAGPDRGRDVLVVEVHDDPPAVVTEP
jgi:hypothetical protein